MKPSIDPRLDLVLERQTDVSPRRPEPFFTAVVLFESDGKGGSKYTAIAMHRDEDIRKKHEGMGFHQGWGQVFDQLSSTSSRGARAGSLGVPDTLRPAPLDRRM